MHQQPYRLELIVNRTRSERRDGRMVVAERWQERCEVEITISDAAVRYVADCACRNATARSKSGPVVARCVKRVRLPSVSAL